MKITTQDRSLLSLHEQSSLKWIYSNIPQSLSEIEQWIPCYIIGQTDSENKPVTSPKRPIGGPGQAFGYSLNNLIPKLDDDNYQHFGFVLKDTDNIIIIDVDDLPPNFTYNDLPQPVKDLLEYRPTYMELSPSGQGVHIIYSTEKAELAHLKAKTDSLVDMTGTLFIHTQFLTFTGHKFETPFTSSEVSTIKARLLEATLVKPRITSSDQASPMLQPQQGIPTNHGLGIQTVHYSMDTLKNALFKIPPSVTYSKYEHIIRHTYNQFVTPMPNISDYDHWRIIAAALHHASALIGQAHEGAALFAEWSSQDELNFVNIEDAMAKYHANPPKTDQEITYKTLFRLANSLKPNWPYLKEIGPKDDRRLVPIETNSFNWIELFKFFGLQVYQNSISKAHHIEGPKLLLDKYFSSGEPIVDKEKLQTQAFMFGQDNGMPNAGPSCASLGARALLTTRIEFNPIKRWIESAPPLENEPGSWFQALWDTLTLHPHADEELCKSYMKKNLMGVIRAHWYMGSYAATTGVVILQGPEQTFKSTWIQQLLPHNLSQHYVVASQAALSKTSVKELQLEAGVAQIWLKDEIEEFLKSGDAALKNFLVQSEDFYRPLYGTTPLPERRKCVFFGTTNKKELAITDDGSRRIMVIPVLACNTTAQAKLPMVKVYQELLQEFKNTPASQQPNLWILSADEIKKTNEINSNVHKADQEVDLLIKETFVFSETFELDTYLTERGAVRYDDPRVMTLTQVATAIRDRTNQIVKVSVLKHSLARVLGVWTKTAQEPVQMGAITIENGLLKYRDSKGRVKRSGYLMPIEASIFELGYLKQQETLN